MKWATLDLPLAGLEFKAKRILTDISTSDFQRYPSLTRTPDVFGQIKVKVQVAGNP